MSSREFELERVFEVRLVAVQHLDGTGGPRMHTLFQNIATSTSYLMSQTPNRKPRDSCPQSLLRPLNRKVV